MTTTATRPVDQTGTDEAIEAWLHSLGRRVEPTDITAARGRAAVRYALAYTGTFDFMLDMKAAAGRKGLTVGQCKAVLNCWRAEVLKKDRTLAAPKPAAPAYVAGPNEFHLLDGHMYRTQENRSKSRIYALRLDLPARFEGHTARAHWNYEAGVIYRLTAETRVTLEDAARFGHLHGFCGLCGARLDRPESVKRGFGPVCAKKLG